jgi:hypothetical protein
LFLASFAFAMAIGAGLIALLSWAAISTAIKTGTVRPVLALSLAFGVIVLTFGYRGYRHGVYAGDDGVRVVDLLRSRTYPWDSIHKFRIDPADPLDHYAKDRFHPQSLHIVFKDGTSVGTPIQFPDNSEMPDERAIELYLAGETHCLRGVDQLTAELTQARRRAGHDV